MKILHIFKRDLKTTFRQFFSLWIIFIPILLALIINAATPGAADTPVRIALLRGGNSGQAANSGVGSNPGQASNSGVDANSEAVANPGQAAYVEQVAYMEKYANIELFDSMAALEDRVLARDDVGAIIPDGGGGYVILTQGNEPEHIVSAIKLFKTYWEQNVQIDPAMIQFHDFGRTNPPLKITLTAALVLLLTLLSGMIIATNVVDEKADRTIRAIRVAPVSLTGFVLGKSLIGILNSLVCGILCVLVAGFSGINFAKVLLILLSATFISLLVGFIAGLNSSDFISAAANLKLLIVPFVASVFAIELIGEKWRWLFYWSPFYWAYSGIKGVLSQTARWNDVFQCAGFTIAITAIVYLIFYPGVKKKLI